MSIFDNPKNKVKHSINKKSSKLSERKCEECGKWYKTRWLTSKICFYCYDNKR